MNLAKATEYSLYCESVALRLWGEPTQTTAKELRWGTHGSRCLDRKTGRWFDHEANEGGSTIELLRREHGYSFTEAAAWLRREGLTNGHASIIPQEATKPALGRIVATYDYRDEAGALLFQVVRFEPKDFRQRRPDGRGGWVWSIKGVRPVLYRLPELIEAVTRGQLIFIVEGEKDADNLIKLDVPATTNAMGVGKWRPNYNKHLQGADVIVVPDNDQAGRDHAEHIAAALGGIAHRIRVLDIGKYWAECPDKGDISAWLAAGGSAEKLKAIVDALPEAPTSAEAPRPLMRDLPPADPFPTDTLGALLAKAARGIQDRTRAPIAMCGQSVLAAATLATQGHANVRLPTGQLRPISSYFVSVGVTGERKSAVDTEATWPMSKYEATLRDEYGPKKLDYDNDKEAWDKARDHAKTVGKGNKAAIKAALDQLGSPPAEPPLPRLTCSEPTIEGLVKLFARGRPSLGLFADEGGMFIGGHAMTEEAKLRTASTLSKLWDGAVVDRVRGGEGAISLPGRRLAMHLMVQPAVATMLLGDALLADQGLLSRILVTYPASAIGERVWRKASDASGAAICAYGGRLLHILEQALPLAAGKGNELAPRELPLSANAQARWITFHDYIERELKEEGGELWPIRGFANKLPEHAARLAAVIALVHDIVATEVDEANMKRGIALAEHYASEALRLFEASLVNADLMLAQRLLDWLHRQWPEAAISLPDIYQRSLNAIRDKATAGKMVAILQDHGWLEPISGGAIVAGRQRRQAWRIVRGS